MEYALNKSDIFLIGEMRLCNHPISDGNAKFCPACGKEMWAKSAVPIPQYDDERDTLCGFRVFKNGYEDSVIVASEFTEVDNYSDIPSEKIDIKTIEKTKQKLKTALVSCGLWNENRFGIWPVFWYV